jgi:hypothetical protein
MTNQRDGAKSSGGRFHRWMNWLLQERQQGPDLGHRIALVLSFLVAGILALVNFDRTLHQASSTEIGYQASQHGWPFVYLTRQFDETTPNHIREVRKSDWPFPAVAGEARSITWPNLVADFLIAATIIGAVYWTTRRLAG